MQILLFVILSFSTLAKARNILPMVSESDSLEVIKEFVIGAFPLGSELLLFSKGTNEYAKGPLDLTAPTRTGRFGKMSDWKRFPVAEASPKASFVGAFESPKGLVLIDGAELMTYRLNAEGKVVLQGNIIWDRLLPYRDAIGEAPKVEQKALREHFLKELRNSDQKIKSLALIQKTAQTFDFLALTSSTRVPLVSLSCKIDTPTFCEVLRECKLPKAVPKSKSLRGLGFDVKTGNLVLGDFGAQSIYVFKPGKCDGTQGARRLALDKKYKAISSLFVDSESRLWLGTEKRDDYLNASLFLHQSWL